MARNEPVMSRTLTRSAAQRWRAILLRCDNRYRSGWPVPEITEEPASDRQQQHLDACGPAVGTRIVSAFQASAGMQHHDAGMTHRVGISLVQNCDVVAGRKQAIDQIVCESRLHPQISVRRTPGAAEQPPWRIERLLERLAKRDIAR